jgi:hypothetical protein
VLGLAHVPIAVGGAGKHGLGSLAGAMQAPPAHALGDLSALVFGDHPLELAQQLLLGRARALGLAGEHDLHPRPAQLLEQQHLVGVAAGEPVGRVAQHRAREALVAEDKLLGDEQAAVASQLTQLADLALDGPLAALAIRRDAGVDRRHARRYRSRLSHRRSPLLSGCWSSDDGTPAPRSSTPGRDELPQADQGPAPPQSALPSHRPAGQPSQPPSSPTRTASAVVALRLRPLFAAAWRTESNTDRGSLTVNTAGSLGHHDCLRIALGRAYVATGLTLGQAVLGLKHTTGGGGCALAKQLRRPVQPLGELVGIGAAACHQSNKHYASRPTPPRRHSGPTLKLEVRYCMTPC